MRLYILTTHTYIYVGNAGGYIRLSFILILYAILCKSVWPQNGNKKRVYKFQSSTYLAPQFSNLKMRLSAYYFFLFIYVCISKFKMATVLQLTNPRRRFQMGI